jgi:hypothetical protein
VITPAQTVKMCSLEGKYMDHNEANDGTHSSGFIALTLRSSTYFPGSRAMKTKQLGGGETRCTFSQTKHSKCIG